MPFCSQCGKKMLDGSNFCEACGTPIVPHMSHNASSRRLEYVGKVLKCPSCGHALSSFEAICPSCGYELNSVNSSESVQQLISSLNKYDEAIARYKSPQSGWNSWSTGIKILWCIFNFYTCCIPLFFYLLANLSKLKPSLTRDEKEKLALIINYSFPNDRATILEALLFIQSQLRIISQNPLNSNTTIWANAWENKANELITKANILLKQDAILEEIKKDIQKSIQTIKNKKRIRLFFTGGIILMSVLFYFYITRDRKKEIPSSTTNQIPYSRVSFNHWLSDNFVVNETDVKIVSKAQNKLQLTFDLSCKESMLNELNEIINLQKGKNLSEYTLKSIEIKLNGYRIYTTESDSDEEKREIRFFINDLINMEINEHKTFDLVITPSYTEAQKLIDASSLLIDIELVYSEINGYNTIWIP